MNVPSLTLCKNCIFFQNILDNGTGQCWLNPPDAVHIQHQQNLIGTTHVTIQTQSIYRPTKRDNGCGQGCDKKDVEYMLKNPMEVYGDPAIQDSAEVRRGKRSMKDIPDEDGAL